MAISAGPMKIYEGGNDYPMNVSDTGFVASSFRDGIFHEAAEGFFKGTWNKYNQSVLPEEEWSSATSADVGKVFPKQYGTKFVVDQSAFAPSAYVSEGLSEVITSGVYPFVYESASGSGT